MSDNDTDVLASERAELDSLLHDADRGHLVPGHWSRIRELGRRVAAADGAQAGADLTAEADVLRLRGHG